jgi:hypothetical protein
MRRFERKAILMAAAAAIFAAAPAYGNDSTAELTAGGLVFKTTPNIEMRSEDLFISRKRVIVRYRFFNRAASDETATVAFPMPDLDYDIELNVSIPNPESDNFLNFQTKVDGKPVETKIEQKAFAQGTTNEITKILTARGIPLMPAAKRTQGILDKLDKTSEKELTDLGIVRADDFDAGKGMEHHLAPMWKLSTTYYWQQTFPAGKEIVVEHSYEPSVGSTVEVLLYRSAVNDPETKAKYEKDYCPDKAFLAGIKSMVKKDKQNNEMVPPEYRLGYILKTGANWAGPIGDYRLTVDKGNSKALISFCETDVKKIGPTTFEVRHTNFTPTQDLNFLIVEPVEQQ